VFGDDNDFGIDEVNRNFMKKKLYNILYNKCYLWIKESKRRKDDLTKIYYYYSYESSKPKKLSKKSCLMSYIIKPANYWYISNTIVNRNFKKDK